MKNMICLFGLCFCLSVFAQPVLEKSCNMFRDGDNLIKQQVEYKSPGKAGGNQFWDFGGLKSVDEHYKLSYLGRDSLIIAREHRTLYKYLLRHDSLFSIGYENPTTMMNYYKPELQLVFPVHYQDKRKAAYSGEGEYCGRLKLTSQGDTDFAADAYGMIILPSGDTLNNVLRVHLTKRIVGQITPDSGDSLDMQVDTYRWYADGYRYPVFETVESQYLKDQKTVKHFNTAFYYTPEEQYYGLESDDDNQEKRERFTMDEILMKQSGGKDKNRDTGKHLSDGRIEYQAEFSNDGNHLLLHYNLAEDSKVSIMLFDMQGRLLVRYPVEQKMRGEYSCEISLEDYQLGEYLLRLVVDNEVFGEKIVKRLN